MLTSEREELFVSLIAHRKRRPKMKPWMKTLAIVAALGTTAAVASEYFRNVSEYNLENGIGLKGYDPVSYFEEGGGEPLKGSEAIALEHEGVIYFFANEDNLDTFLKDTEKYEPTYGGYCAYAMARGSKIDINPKLFILNGRRAHFFVNNRAKRNFARDIAGDERKADDNWREISGEEPRL